MCPRPRVAGVAEPGAGPFNLRPEHALFTPARSPGRTLASALGWPVLCHSCPPSPPHPIANKHQPPRGSPALPSAGARAVLAPRAPQAPVRVAAWSGKRVLGTPAGGSPGPCGGQSDRRSRQ